MQTPNTSERGGNGLVAELGDIAGGTPVLMDKSMKCPPTIVMFAKATSALDRIQTSKSLYREKSLVKPVQFVQPLPIPRGSRCREFCKRRRLCNLHKKIV